MYYDPFARHSIGKDEGRRLAASQRPTIPDGNLVSFECDMAPDGWVYDDNTGETVIMMCKPAIRELVPGKMTIPK